MADLRERLQALVEEWQRWCQTFTPQAGSYDAGMWRAYKLAADQLAAILAEGEGEPQAAWGVLPLGHEFVTIDGERCSHKHGRSGVLWICGQPRAAHEAK